VVDGRPLIVNDDSATTDPVFFGVGEIECRGAS
jgi:hypothetical protein